MLLRQRLLLAEEMRQIAERIVVPHPFGSSRFANTAQRRLLQIEHLFDHHRRNRVTLAARPHDQRLGDRQRQRNVEAEFRSPPLRG